MKKILIAIILFNFMCACFVTNVNAAYAYSWTVNGELLTTLNNSNKEGTAIWTSDEKYSGGVLTLNNYSGGQLKIDCYGTGLNHVFAVKLVGDNKIDVENGIGIIANAPVIFIGNGTLTISAPIPIGTDDDAYDSNTNSFFDLNKIDYYKKTTIVIDPSAKGSIDNIKINIKGYHSSQNNSEKSDSSKEENNSDLSNAEETDSNKNNENINETDETSNSESDKRKEHQGVLDSNLFKVIVLLYCVISLITIVILIIKLASKRKL